MTGVFPPSARAVAAQLLVWAVVASAGWDYSENGADWGRKGYGLCAGDGQFSQQSPIDLPLRSVEPTGLRKVFLKYPPLDTTFSLYNNGHSLAFTLPEAYNAGFGFVPEEADLQGENAAVYRAWQVSFHAPSEHTLAGRRLPLEIQIVHQRVTGGEELAVVSVLFEEDSAMHSPFLDALLADGLPTQLWHDTQVNLVRSAKGSSSDDQLGLQALLTNSPFFAYEGSLTTPPCETGVRRFVRLKTQTASPGQIQSFKEALLAVGRPRGNYRVQPTNSTAGNVVLVGAVDTIGGSTSSAVDGAERAEDLHALVGGQGALDREVIANNPRLGEIRYNDSPELQNAKEEYKQAQVGYAAAQSAKDEATSQFNEAQAMYSSAQGTVAKIALKMKVVESQNTMRGMDGSLRMAKQKLDTAANDLLTVWRADRETDHSVGGIAELPTTSAIPTEFGSMKVATTVQPYSAGQHFGKTQLAIGPLEYPEPTVSLPRGLAASPFSKHGGAQTQVTVGSGPMHSEAAPLTRLAPNLRQFDGPDGYVKMPYRSGSASLVELSHDHRLSPELGLAEHPSPGRARLLARGPGRR
mmetsp:Transcript_11465/g.40778  ORF Transcript_11465/g.40778 Transcript_11465/m.40778 type:complete len:580 (-) Transcript_11465:121-1860(-)